jgi:thiol-disulfide isomerase/thioredoxin
MTPVKRYRELTKLQTQGLALKAKMEKTQGQDYLDAFDKYYAFMNARTTKAIDYLSEFSPDNWDKENLLNLLEIAKAAKDESQIVNILEQLFTRFPESRQELELVQTFFTNAYLLKPGIISHYVDFNIFPAGEQLYCYYMLALGFAETADREQAMAYFQQANDLFNILISDEKEQTQIPVLYIVGLQSFIAEILGDRALAGRIIKNARDSFADLNPGQDLDKAARRLNALTGLTPLLETTHSIGPTHPLEPADYRGKVVLLDFFSWDCDSCNLSYPYLKRLRSELNNQDFVILGVTRFMGHYIHQQNLNHQQEYEWINEHYIRAYKIDWPLSLGLNAFYNYGVTAAPTYLLVDKQGRLRDGYYINNYSYLKNRIELLLAE